MTEQLEQAKQANAAPATESAGRTAQEQVQVQLDAVTRAMDRVDEEARLAAEERQRQQQAERQEQTLRRSEEERMRAEDALRTRELTERKELGMTLAETYRQRRREEKERRAALAAKRKEARRRAEAEAEKKRQELEQRLAAIERERADAQRRVEDSEALLREAEQVRRELNELGPAAEEPDATERIEPVVTKSATVAPPSTAEESAAEEPVVVKSEAIAPTVLTYGASEHRLRPEAEAATAAPSSASPLSYVPLYYVSGGGIPLPTAPVTPSAPESAPPRTAPDKPHPTTDSRACLTGTVARLQAVQAGIGAPNGSSAAPRPAPLSVSAVPRPAAAPTIVPESPKAEKMGNATDESSASAAVATVAVSGAESPAPAAMGKAEVVAGGVPAVTEVVTTPSPPAEAVDAVALPSEIPQAEEDIVEPQEPDPLPSDIPVDPVATSVDMAATPPPQVPAPIDVPAPTPIPEVGLRTLPQEQTPPPAIPIDPATDALTAGLPATPDPLDTEREAERQRLTEMDGYANEWERTEQIRALDKRTYRRTRSRYLRAERRLAKKGVALERATRHSFGRQAQKKAYERLTQQQERIRMMSWRLLGADAVGDTREHGRCEKELATLIGSYHRLLTDYEKLTGTREQRLPDDYVQRLVPYGRMPVLPPINPPPAQTPRLKMSAADRHDLEKLGAAGSEADALALMGGTKGGVPLREQWEREKQVNEARLAYREGQLRYRIELSRLSVGGIGAGHREKQRAKRQLSRIRHARRALLASVKADNTRYERVASTEAAYAKCARGADRERMEQLRVRLCALLAERDAANRRLLTLYRGVPEDATPARGARMERRVTDGKLQAAAKNKRKNKKLEKRVLKMQIRESEKEALFSLMNRRGALTAELAELRYRLRHSAKDRAQKKACRQQMRRLRRALRANERDLSRQLRHAERQDKNNRRDRVVARRTLLSLIVLLVLVALGLLTWRLLLPALTEYLPR